MDIFSGIASVLSGGVTGLIGTVAQKVFEFKTKQLEIELQKEKFANDVEMKKAEAAIMAQEWAARTQVAKIETEGASDVADSKAFAVSLASEPQRYATGTLSEKQNWFMVVLDFMKGIIRPFLTLYLCAITTVLYISARKLVPDMVSVDDALAMVSKITDTLLYLFVTCTCWWFGSRGTKKS
jgi:hypothetical protein